MGIVAPRAGAWIETPALANPSARTYVAPRAGAWIETDHTTSITDAQLESLPVRERGLKPKQCHKKQRNIAVAPRAGAWIETLRKRLSRKVKSVAPRAGAWIETPQKGPLLHTLKVAPRAGAWIETFPPGSTLNA